MTKICCVCQRVENGSHWKEEYEFAENERVTHGYCPLCFDVIMAELMESWDDVPAETRVVSASGQDSGHQTLCA